MTKARSPISPADQWGASVSAVVTVLCLSGVPTRLGLTADDVGALAFGTLTIAAALRAAWQSWRARDLGGAVGRVEQLAADPRVAAAFEFAVARAVERLAPKSEAQTVREPAPEATP